MTQTLSKASHSMLWMARDVLGFGSFGAECVLEWQEAQNNSDRLAKGDDSFSSRN